MKLTFFRKHVCKVRYVTNRHTKNHYSNVLIFVNCLYANRFRGTSINVYVNELATVFIIGRERTCMIISVINYERK